MSEPFSRSMRSLRADSFRPTMVTLGVVVALAAVWAVWFFFAKVSVYAVTDTARLEVDEESYPLEAPVSGRVIATNMRLGSRVRQGDVLVELDSEQIRFQLEESKAKKNGLARQLNSLQKEIRAQTRALGQARQAEVSAIEEARAQYEQAEAAARLADEEARQTVRIHEKGLVSDADKQRATAEAEQRRAAAMAKRKSLKRLEADRRFDQSEKQALLAELERKAELLQGELSTVEAVTARLEHEHELHRIRAPVSGRIGEVVPLREGAFVDAGERLAAIVPPGRVRIVAEFDPPDALGRIRPPQKARLRLEGFPWIQYGSLRATVERVGSETHNAKIRVELRVDPHHGFPVTLQHGLPGVLEVEVERVSPAALVLRAAGKALSRPTGGRRPRTEPSRVGGSR